MNVALAAVADAVRVRIDRGYDTHFSTAQQEREQMSTDTPEANTSGEESRQIQYEIHVVDLKAHTFLEIAEKALSAAESADHAIDEHRPSDVASIYQGGAIPEDVLEALFESGSQKTNNIAICVVFSAFAIEAALNHFIDAMTLDREDKNKIRKELYNLRLEAKCILVPKIFGGEFLSPSSHLMRDVKELVRLRNDLAHAKTEVYPASEFAEREVTLDHARKHVQTAKAVFQYLEEVEGGAASSETSPDS